MENVFETTPDNLVKLMENIRSDNIGICLDIGHFNLFSEITFSDWWSKIEKYVTHLHVHDNNGKRDLHIPPGLGEIDWDEYLEKISCKSGLTYTFEMHSLEHIKYVVEKIGGFNV